MLKGNSFGNEQKRPHGLNVTNSDSGTGGGMGNMGMDRMSAGFDRMGGGMDMNRGFGGFGGGAGHMGGGMSDRGSGSKGGCQIFVRNVSMSINLFNLASDTWLPRFVT